MKTEQGKKLTMTAEFGPPPYMWTHPMSGEALADVWEVNVTMKNLWEKRYMAITWGRTPAKLIYFVNDV